MLNVGGAPASKVYVGSNPAKAVYVGATQVWPQGEPYLYGIDQITKPGRVVDFTALKGFVPADPQDEAFMFRCSTISGLDGYVARTFTKTFPSGTAYTRFECTLQDMYGDGTANPDMLKTISFTVTPTA